jgi:hypothetical protein
MCRRDATCCWPSTARRWRAANRGRGRRSLDTAEEGYALLVILSTDETYDVILGAVADVDLPLHHLARVVTGSRSSSPRRRSCRLT